MPPTWIPVSCPGCGGLRDGSEDGPPWPFHVKGRYPCECDEDALDLADGGAGSASLSSPPPEEG